MKDGSAELDVTWQHDRLHAVLPVDRDRALPVLALFSCAAIMGMSSEAGFAPGIVLGILPLVFRDRRRAEITIDLWHVTVERWFLGRPRRVRIPLLELNVPPGAAADRLCLCGPDSAVRLRWGGSRQSLQWLVEQIERAQETALPAEEPPEPPSELSRLRGFASRGPGAREDHLRV